MILHEDKDAFNAAINQAAEAQSEITSFMLEKDYWITLCLKNLAYSGYKEYAVFKGGTCLSKVHGIIKRFSEDIDIAITKEAIDEYKIKKRASDSCYEIVKKIKPSEFTKEEVGNSSGPELYKRSYTYGSTQVASQNEGHDRVVIEVNCMGNPAPTEIVSVESYLARILRNNMGDFQSFSEAFKLESFEVKSIKVEKTLCEKILAVRNAYETSIAEENPRFFADRVRHIYDIHKIIQIPEYFDFLNSGNDFADLFRKAQEDDGKSKNFPTKIHECHFYAAVEEEFGKIETAFHRNLRAMTFDQSSPETNEIVETLNRISEILKNLDL